MNKKIVAIVFVLALVFVLAGTASAAVKQGDKELSFSGAYADIATKSGSDFDLGCVKATLLSGALGYFVSDEVEFSAKSTWAWLKASGEKLNLYGIGFDAKYHFQPSNSTVPYVGAQWVYLNGKVSGDTLSVSGKASGQMWGPLAGIKFFVTDSTILFVEYQYDLFTGGAKDAINHANLVSAGISFKF
jgi:opacity protein-like surface antigen